MIAVFLVKCVGSWFITSSQCKILCKQESFTSLISAIKWCIHDFFTPVTQLICASAAWDQWLNCTCCFLVCSFRRTADSSRVSSCAGVWWRGGSLAAVMSSRCLRSRSFLASAESREGPSDEPLGEDSDGELLPLSGILETQDNRFLNYYVRVIFYLWPVCFRQTDRHIDR